MLDTKSVSELASKLNPDCIIALDVIIDAHILPTNPLEQIGLLLNLQDLSIDYFGEAKYLAPSHMLPLKNLKRVRCLKIYNLHLSPMLTDEDFVSMAENWPELEILEISSQFLNISRLSTTSLTSLGKHCPRLEDLSIVGVGEYDLNDWQNIPRPVFPQLRRLFIGDLIDSKGETQ